MFYYISLAGAEVVITADQGVRGGKTIDLKRTVDEAVSKCSGVRHVFMMSRTGADVPMGKKDISLEKVPKTSYQLSISLLTPLPPLPLPLLL
jgi:acyl-coenzyme A synthetase/AMP-(fatty) acid ligase